MALARWSITRSEDPLAASKKAASGKAEKLRNRRSNAALDVASRISALLGVQARPETLRKDIPDSDLMRYTGKAEWPGEDLEAIKAKIAKYILSWPSMPTSETYARVLGLDAFTRELCTLTLQPHQLAMAAATLGSRRSIVLAGRQSGKSVTLSAIALYQAVCVPNSKIIVVAAADRQSQEISTKAMGLVAQTQELFDSIKTSNRELLEFRNSSWIRFLPATGQIRGFTATLVLFDEARDLLDEDAVYSSLEPMLVTTGGSMALYSTPFQASGKLWDAFHSPLYAKVRARTADTPFASPEHLEKQRLEMSAAMYACEYEGEFMEAVASYFSSAALRSCTRDYEIACAAQSDKHYALGIDWAATRDSSVFVVSSQDSDGRVKVEWIKAYEGVPITDQKPYVAYLDSIFHFDRITTEAAGLGIQVSDELQREFHSRVLQFKPTADEKAKAFEWLKSLVERNEIQIPYYPAKLLAEMRTFEFKIGQTGIMQLHAPEGMSDDHVHALCYSVLPWRRKDKGGVVDVSRLYGSVLGSIADAPSSPSQIENAVAPPAGPKDLVKEIRHFPSPGPCIKCNRPIGPQEAFTESTTMRGLLHVSCGQLTSEDIARIRRSRDEARSRSRVWMRRDSVFGYPRKDENG